MSLEPVGYLVEGAARLGVDLNRADAEELLRFKAELVSWNLRFNLTSLTTDEEVLEKHFLDSLAVWPHGGFGNGMSVVDLGTGAGLPGLVLALYGKNRLLDASWTLVDSVNKKVGFVQHAARLLGLDNVLAIQGRAEDLGRKAEYREAFDCAIARAVARLSVLCEYVLPLLRVGGRFLAMKGPKVTEELAEAQQAISILGGRVVTCEEYVLPYSGDRRALVVIDKIVRTPGMYPRRAGIPERSPLILQER